MTNTISRLGGTTSTITFNANSDAVISNVVYTTTNALGVQEKPFAGPDIIHDLGISDILVFVSGYFTYDNTTDIAKVRTWLLEDKTHTSYSFGRFSINMDVDVFNKTADAARGYILYDAQITEEAEPHRVAFTLRFRFSGSSWS